MMRKKWLLTLSGSLLAAMLVTGCAVDDEDPAPPEDTTENDPVEENVEEGLEEGGDVIEEGVEEGGDMLEEGAEEGEEMLEEGNVNEDQNANKEENK